MVPVRDVDAQLRTAFGPDRVARDAPLGSLTLKLITHAGAGCSVGASAGSSAVGEMAVMRVLGKPRGEPLEGGPGDL